MLLFMYAVYLYISDTMTGHSGSSEVKQRVIGVRHDHAYGKGNISTTIIIVIVTCYCLCMLYTCIFQIQ